MGGFFDPAPLKPKACVRPRIVLPKTTRRGCFVAIYSLSMLVWGGLFATLAALVMWLAVPPLFGIIVPVFWFWLLALNAFVFGSILGMFIGTRLNAQIITAGIELGDASVVRDGEDGYNHMI